MIKVFNNLTFRIEEGGAVVVLTPWGWQHVSSLDNDDDVDSQIEEIATDFIQMCEFVTKMTNNEV